MGIVRMADTQPAWVHTLQGIAPPDAIEAATTSCAGLPEDKGEGRIRRVLGGAFTGLEPHEKAAGHPTCVCYVLIMLSPKDANIFDLVGHALKASATVGIPPGVK